MNGTGPALCRDHWIFDSCSKKDVSHSIWLSRKQLLFLFSSQKLLVAWVTCASYESVVSCTPSHIQVILPFFLTCPSIAALILRCSSPLEIGSPRTKLAGAPYPSRDRAAVAAKPSRCSVGVSPILCRFLRGVLYTLFKGHNS